MAVKFKDYYEVLGVARDADADAVKKAFRRLARKFHPDVSKEPDAATRMSEINEANEVLSDPERRAAYDAIGQGRQPGESFTPPPGWDEGFEFTSHDGQGMDARQFSEFFESLFGQRAGGSHRRAQARPDHGPRRGEDHHAHIVLELADAWRGALRQLTLRSPELDASGRMTVHERTLDVRIPAGVRAGQLIRLAGQGSPGHGGAPAGDLLLEVQFRPHPRFQVDGANVLAELPVAPWEAALGAVVPVELPDGTSLQVRVPANAQSGRVISVRGKGLPGKLPGDLDLSLRVVMPSALDPRARAIYERMAQELPEFDARKVSAAETGA